MEALRNKHKNAGGKKPRAIANPGSRSGLKKGAGG